MLLPAEGIIKWAAQIICKLENKRSAQELPLQNAYFKFLVLYKLIFYITHLRERNVLAWQRKWLENRF